MKVVNINELKKTPSHRFSALSFFLGMLLGASGVFYFGPTVEAKVVNAIIPTWASTVENIMRDRVFKPMGDRILDPQRYSERMASRISHDPRCAKYRNNIIRVGKESEAIDGRLAHMVIEEMAEADKDSCRNDR